MRHTPPDPRAAQLELLNEIARIALLDLELGPMLQRITDALAAKFGWEFVALVTVDQERNVFRCEALTTTESTSIYVGYSRALGSGIVGRVAATGVAALVDDVSLDPDYIETLPGAVSELCVPVHHRGQRVAVLNVESRRPAAFRDQLALLETVADQVSGVIASAQLYHQLELKTRALEEANAHLSKAIETLHRISTEDSLTTVPNRRHFDESLQSEWRRAIRSGESLSLLMVDIDAFKELNDTHGHPAGDEALRQLARQLRECFHRAADLVARYGGEEFVVLLPGASHEQAFTMAEALRRNVESAGVITVSVGVATCVPHLGEEPHQLLSRADAALYEAKRAGRNVVR